jgi:hypothetical protein
MEVDVLLHAIVTSITEELKVTGKTCVPLHCVITNSISVDDLNYVFFIKGEDAQDELHLQ